MHIDRGLKVPDHNDIRHHSLPTTWVKAAMLVRLNSIIRGHSGVSRRVTDSLLNLIRNNLIPIVPLKGTVSASGDLMPLSHIAGAIEGNLDVFIQSGSLNHHRVVSAKEALEMGGTKPVSLAPKEGLGLINGTAVSAAVAILDMYETIQLAILSQVLTAMGVEALL